MDFSQCFEDGKPLLQQIENWQQTLKTYCSQSFRKIRIKKKSVKPLKQPLSMLINERNALIKDCEKPEDEQKLEIVTRKIFELEAEDNRNKIVKNFKSFSENTENVNMQQMWKNMKRIWPKSGTALPVAKKNHRGKIVSGAKDIKNLLAIEYRDRLRSRPVRPDLVYMKKRKKKIFKLKMKLAQKKQSPDWVMSDLDTALSNLWSRDPEGYVNEIFKHGVIGKDMKKSLLVMMNEIRRKKLIPKLMNIANVTTVTKRGSRLLLKNERGIFRIAVLRYILMRLLYNTKYPVIHKNISDCQMGARKHKGCKNNIFILNGIIHETLKSKRMKPVDLRLCTNV